MISPTNYKLLLFLNLAKVHVGKERFTNIPDTKKEPNSFMRGCSGQTDTLTSVNTPWVVSEVVRLINVQKAKN